MTLHCASRRAGPPQGRLLALLLSLMLLLVQQGALLHELSHHTRPLMQASLQARHNDAATQPGGDEPCELCLAFAQIASASTPTLPVLVLLSGIAFEAAKPTPDDVVMTEHPSARNRGPPQRL